MQRDAPSAGEVLSQLASQGVTGPVLHRMARSIGRNRDLASKLWESGGHGAKLLACLVDEPERVTRAQMERWAREFDSWDLVDCACRYLFLYTPHAWKVCVAWSRRKPEFIKRAGFSQMAYLALHDKQADDTRFEALLQRIEEEARDPRHFVKMAVNWALRQIGKRNLALNRKAIRAAKRIARQDSSAARWVAADALRELNSPAVARRLSARRAIR
ncbi:MAG: DNA alkylation repair protein [Candidatus Acidiferrales bacterium]